MCNPEEDGDDGNSYAAQLSWHKVASISWVASRSEVLPKETQPFFIPKVLKASGTLVIERLPLFFEGSLACHTGSSERFQEDPEHQSALATCCLQATPMHTVT